MSESLVKKIENWNKLEKIAFPVFLVDSNGKIIRFNDSARKTFQIDKDQQHQYFSDFIKLHISYNLNIDFSNKAPGNFYAQNLQPYNNDANIKASLLAFPIKGKKTIVVLVDSNLLTDNSNIKKRHLHYLKIINEISSKSYKYDNINRLSKFVVTELHNEKYNLFQVAIFLRENSFNSDHVVLIEIAGESRDLFRKVYKNGYRQNTSQGVIGEVIKKEKSVIIDDTDKIDYYHCTPIFKGKSEICVPIFMSNHVIGVIDIETRDQKKFDDTDVAFLETISAIFAANIFRIFITEEISKKNDQLNQYLKELEKAKTDLEIKSEELVKSLAIREQTQAFIKRENELMQSKLKMGAELQKSLLPREFPNVIDLKFSSKYLPTLQLGGDFFDVVQIDDYHIGVIIADVSGHGVSAAMIAAMFKALYANYKNIYLHPSEIMDALNTEFYHMINTGEFISSFYMILDLRHYEFIYTNAGHPYPFLYRSNLNCIEELDSPGFFIGVFNNSNYREKKAKLNTGDKLLFYTDGAIEVKNQKEEQFGRGKLKSNFLKFVSQELNRDKLINSLFEEIGQYSEKETFDDDLTLLLIERGG